MFPVVIVGFCCSNNLTFYNHAVALILLLLPNSAGLFHVRHPVFLVDAREHLVNAFQLRAWINLILFVFRSVFALHVAHDVKKGIDPVDIAVIREVLQ